MSDLHRKYESFGGHPALGAHSSDLPTQDGIGVFRECERGVIYWTPDTGAHVVQFGILEAWRLAGGEIGLLGYPVSDEMNTPWPGGRVTYFERGLVLWEAEAGTQILYLDTPQLGAPAFMDTGATRVPRISVNASAVTAPFIRRAETGDLTRVWEGRLYTREVADKTRFMPLIPDPPSIVTSPDGTGITAGFWLAGSLEDRKLYDLCFRDDDGEIYAIAQHAVYAKTDLGTLGIAHVTDLHVSRRVDGYLQRLRDVGLTEAAQRLNNYNDNVRAFVTHANALHLAGALDVILATGDLVDYIYEENDPCRGVGDNGAGNFRLLEEILLGRSAHTRGWSTEELRVPILTTLGNHDYRRESYPVMATVTAGGFGLYTLSHYEGLNLTIREAVAMVGGEWRPYPQQPSAPYYADVPDVSVARAKRAIVISDTVSNGESYFHRKFSRRGSFTAEIGPHRVVMLDTGPDIGIPTSAWSAFWGWLGNGPEDSRTLIGGGPNSRGLRDADIDLVRAAQREAAAEGVVIVAMHAPPLNVKGNEYNYYFRETEHPSAEPLQTAGFLVRRAGVQVDPFSWNVDHRASPDWVRSGTRCFKRGTTQNLLDAGVARENADELLGICVGNRKVDVVLCGHIHRQVEYRISRDDADGMLQYHLDHYTENPREYYPSFEIDHGDIRQRRTVRVFLESELAPPGTSSQTRKEPDRTGANFTEEWRRTVPRNSTTLMAAAEPGAWWAERRPLVLQTAALGPLESNQRPDRSLRPNNRGEFDERAVRPRPGPTFQGFRLMNVQGDVIRQITQVSTLVPLHV